MTMKRMLPCFLFCLIAYLSNAQTPNHKNLVQLHVETLYVKADQRPQSPVTKYSLVYARKLAVSRWIAEGGVSYTSRYVREQLTPFQFFPLGDRSQLVTLDLTFMYNLLRSNRHTFRLGAGPSLWYTRNGTLENLSATTTVGGQRLEDISFTRNYSHTFNLGVALRSSYEYSLTSRVVLGVRASTGGNLLRGDGFSTLVGSLSTMGLSAGYRF
jgi:hypothetical protein